jgi:hypothetical protein
MKLPLITATTALCVGSMLAQTNTSKSPQSSALEAKLVGVKWFSGISKSGRFVITEYAPDHTVVWIKTSINPNAGLRFKWHLEGNKLVYTD